MARVISACDSILILLRTLVRRPVSILYSERAWAVRTGPLDEAGSNAVMAPIMERLRFGLYGLAIGLFVGLILGWIFHGFVSLLVKVGVVAILLIPLFFAVRFWLRMSSKPVSDSSVQEAEWHEGSGWR